MIRGVERTRLAAVLFGVLLLVGAEASARNETLQWTHSDPSTVNSFTVYWRLDGSSTLTQVPAGLPPIQSGNLYGYTVSGLPDTGGVWFTVRASNAGGSSPSSNEICRGCGGTTTPPPTGGDGGGGTVVTGFKVWNAQTDTVIDDDFQSGETITASCAAIEIVGSISGSVRKTFDNNLGACENSAPFGYDDGSTVGQWNCSTLLTNGSHSLSVTVYSAKDCTGTPATPVSRTFSVSTSGTTTPPPTEETLGTPGKPYLVP